MLIEHRFAVIPADIAEEAGLPTCTADFAHVDWLDDYQSSHCEELKFAPKLKKKDIHPAHFMKMKVTTSTNVISLATSASLEHLAEQGTGDEGLKTTAWLIKLLRKWFDLITGRSLTHALSFRNQEAYEDAINIFRVASYVFRHMKVGETGAWKPAQTHFIMSTEAMIELQGYLLKEEGFLFFFCGRINQDGVESGFSNVRRGRPKPSALDFKYQLRTLTIVGQDVEVANASYRFTEVPSLLQCLLKLDKTVAKGHSTNASLILPPLSECEVPGTGTQQILYRMCGYVVLKLRDAIKCGDCYKALLDGGRQAASDVSSFVQKNDYVEGAQVRVCLEVFFLLSAVERIMWHSRNEISMCADSVTEQLCAHFSEVLTEYTLPTCHDVKDKVVRRYVSMRLRQLSTVLKMSLPIYQVQQCIVQLENYGWWHAHKCVSAV